MNNKILVELQIPLIEKQFDLFMEYKRTENVNILPLDIKKLTLYLLSI